MKQVTFWVQGKVPSKKNQFEIHLSGRFRKILSQLAHLGVKLGKDVWVGPDKDTKNYQQLVGWSFKTHCREKLEGHVGVTVHYSGRGDIDNVLGAIFDGIQASGQIDNDRQIKEAHVYWTDPKQAGGTGCQVTVFTVE